MIDKKQLWALAEETMRAFGPFYWETMRQAIEDSGAPDHWFGLRLARGSEPAPLSLERFHAMAPYNSRERLVEVLDTLAQLDLLERVAEDAYRLTDPGRETVEGIFAAAHQALAQITPLPPDEMDQLNDLLYRLVAATLEAPQPQEKWAMIHSRWTDPGESAPGSVKTDQYLTDLLLFRDDAHIAAWKPYDVSGHAWEALTFIWRDEASSAAELAARLPYRSFTVEDYQRALQDLAARGWVVEEASGYQLTAEGKQVREEAEEATERYFYVGWSALSQDELAQLEHLLTRTKESLRTATQGRLWNLVGEVAQAIYPVTRSVVNPLVEKYGLDKPGLFYSLLAARRSEPEPVAAAGLSARGPYTNPTRYDDLLAESAGAGFLISKQAGAYELSEKGRTVLHEVEHAFYTHLGDIAALPAEDVTRVESLLDKVAQACLEAQEPVSKLCIATVHQGHPGQEYAALAKIDQHLDDLRAFRDDAHLAAWRPYDVSGQAWEALTFIWRGEASSSEELAEKLSLRGHSAQAYTEALTELVDRGWLVETAAGYQVTEEGQALRQQAEDATDRYFFAPWACLSDVETTRLYDLLLRLRTNLQKMAEEE